MTPPNDPFIRAVFALLLDEHPAHLSRQEVYLAMATDPREFSERDAVDVALSELVACGLLHRHGEFFFASRAAVCAQRLLDC